VAYEAGCVKGFLDFLHADEADLAPANNARPCAFLSTEEPAAPQAVEEAFGCKMKKPSAARAQLS